MARFSLQSRSEQSEGRELGDTARIFIIAVVTFVAALIWRDALKRVFAKYFPRNNLGAHVVAAVVVSIIAILVIYHLSKGVEQVNLDVGDDLDDIPE